MRSSASVGENYSRTCPATEDRNSRKHGIEAALARHFHFCRRVPDCCRSRNSTVVTVLKASSGMGTGAWIASG